MADLLPRRTSVRLFEGNYCVRLGLIYKSGRRDQHRERTQFRRLCHSASQCQPHEPNKGDVQAGNWLRRSQQRRRPSSLCIDIWHGTGMTAYRNVGTVKRLMPRGALRSPLPDRPATSSRAEWLMSRGTAPRGAQKKFDGEAGRRGCSSCWPATNRPVQPAAPASGRKRRGPAGVAEPMCHHPGTTKRVGADASPAGRVCSSSGRRAGGRSRRNNAVSRLPAQRRSRRLPTALVGTTADCSWRLADRQA